ncbi:MAG: hypothetical protein AVDCRST_MAG18-3654 [uncultured Thermomicrobiales bacterium]|uniref:Uncharacterized protein n=1 Tax=uncultured Thermomicrobiales bacterium TaxID=1645740 RepID=A0A6J4VWB0_9BACT|nr:MAG: hypothetical protein AVDCRST_MAG18-3654 [uncultured Thermomicrobiales bacterium]
MAMAARWRTLPVYRLRARPSDDETRTPITVQLEAPPAPAPPRTPPAARRREARAPWTHRLGHALWAPAHAQTTPTARAPARPGAAPSVAPAPLRPAGRAGDLPAAPALRDAAAERWRRRAAELLELLVDRAGALGGAESLLDAIPLRALWCAALSAYAQSLQWDRGPAGSVGVRDGARLQHGRLPLVHPSGLFRLPARRGGERQSAGGVRRGRRLRLRFLPHDPPARAHEPARLGVAARLSPLPPPRDRRDRAAADRPRPPGGRRAAPADALRLAVRHLRGPLHTAVRAGGQPGAALARAVRRRGGDRPPLGDPRCAADRADDRPDQQRHDRPADRRPGASALRRPAGVRHAVATGDPLASGAGGDPRAGLAARQRRRDIPRLPAAPPRRRGPLARPAPRVALGGGGDPVRPAGARPDPPGRRRRSRPPLAIRAFPVCPVPQRRARAGSPQPRRHTLPGDPRRAGARGAGATVRRADRAARAGGPGDGARRRAAPGAPGDPFPVTSSQPAAVLSATRRLGRAGDRAGAAVL